MYTDTLADQAVAGIVRGIRDAGATAFASPAAMGAEDVGTFTYYTAQKQPGTPLWRVKEIFSVRAGDDFQVQQKTIMAGLCFFDALHLAASKYQAQIQMGKMPVLDDALNKALGVLRVPSLRDVAEKAGQPLDHKGLPLPAAGGEILVDGVFSGSAMTTADRTAGQEVVYIPPTALMASVEDMFKYTSVKGIFGGGAVMPTTEMVEQQNQRVELIAQYQNILKKKEGVIDALKQEIARSSVIGRKFINKAGVGELSSIGAISCIPAGVIAGIFTLMSAPFWPVFLPIPLTIMVWARLGSNTEGRYKSFLKDLRKQADKMPDGPEKDFMNDFNRTAAGTFDLEHAVIYMDRYRKDRSLIKDLRRAQVLADKGLTAMGVSPEQTSAILNEMSRGAYPGEGHFFRILARKSEEWTEADQKRILSTQSSYGAPQMGGRGIEM